MKAGDLVRDKRANFSKLLGLVVEIQISNSRFGNQLIILKRDGKKYQYSESAVEVISGVSK